jgi:hypothetical protein
MHGVPFLQLIPAKTLVTTAGTRRKFQYRMIEKPYR